MAMRRSKRSRTPIGPSWPPMAKRGEIYLGLRTRKGGLSRTQIAAARNARETDRTIMSRLEPACLRSAGTRPKPGAPLRDAGLSPMDSSVRQPDAVFVARLAATAAGGPPPKPLYLRPPDAKLPTRSVDHALSARQKLTMRAARSIHCTCSRRHGVKKHFAAALQSRRIALLRL